MHRIYRDKNRSESVDNHQLTENEQYYIELNESSDLDPEEVFLESGLSRFISWVPGNTVAELKVTNYIGRAKLGGVEYDIRSSKFLQDSSGDEQLSSLVKDIERITAGISLSADSPSLATRRLDWENPSGSDLHQLNYYYQIFFNPTDSLSVFSLFESAKSHPHFQYSVTSQKDFIWNTKRIDHHFITRALISKSNMSEIISGKIATRSTLAAFRNINTGVITAPLRLDHTRQTLSYDTAENRFIKHFFQNIETLCRRVLETHGKSERLSLRCRKLLSAARQCLSDPFFMEIGEINNIPSESTVLKYRHGYKELAEHYVKSQLGVLPTFQDVLGDLTVELKDVATIYEVWCYYTVASSILGNDIFLEECQISTEAGELFFETALGNDQYSIAYNKSFSRQRGNSYSLTMRPDITVTNKNTGVILALDAKYRVQFIPNKNQEIVSSKHKSSDIHKMHTYIDSIEKCESAVVLYVGSEFTFYQKGDFKQTYRCPSLSFDLMGVGAIPLIPGGENIELAEFSKKL